MKRDIGDKVRINPYSQVTGVIVDKQVDSNPFGFDFKVKLNIPFANKDTNYTYNYDSDNKYWWQYFNNDELDILEKNYELVSR